MNKKYWKNYFSDEVLQRAYNYYQEKHILKFTQETGHITALVDGSKIYEVSIEFEDDEIIRMKCNCPHSFKGNNCKHIACVLYYLDEKT